MAYIYGSSEPSSVTETRVPRNQLLRSGLPLIFLLLLAVAGLYAFLHTHYWLVGFFSILFVGGVLRFEELGLTIAQRFSHEGTNSPADQVVAKTLRLLPNEYHVFHNLHCDTVHIDHAVVGPNGFFLVKTKNHMGNITASGESLRLNGWPFLRDLFDQCWTQAQALRNILDLTYSAGIQLSPVLCFSRANVQISRLVRGVLITQTSSLVPRILEHEDSLSEEKILRLIDKLSEFLSVKNDCVISTPNEAHSFASTAQSQASNRPVCPKCHHQASVEEMELFPDECLKCGSLYSFSPEAPVPALTVQHSANIWQPTVPQLLVAALLIAGGAGIFAHQTGFFSPSQPGPEERQAQETEGTATETPKILTEAAPVPSQPTNASHPPSTATDEEHAARLPSQVQMTSAVANATTSVATEQATQRGNLSSPGIMSKRDSTLHPGTTSANATQASGSLHSSTQAPGPELGSNATVQGPRPKSPAEYSKTGTLKITSPHSITVWFTNQQTFKQFGPYETNANAAKDIVLPKGIYSVLVLAQGKRKQTTMSFLSDKGQLDF